MDHDPAFKRKEDAISLAGSASRANGYPKPSVSVVIPTRGRPDLVRNAVNYALAQTLENIEVVVVIDGPDPQTVDVLQKIADARLKLVELNPARGNAGARNAGIDAARADWIALLDDDDGWEAEKLEKQLECARAIDARYPVVSCRFEAKGEGARFVWPAKFPQAGQPISEYLFTRRWPSVTGAIQTSTLFVPKALFDKVRFDEEENRYVDLDWLLRAAELEGFELHFVPGDILSTYSMDHDRARISNQANWRRDLEWIRQRRDIVTARAYGGYCLTQASIRAEKSRDKKAFLPLLREALSFGQVSPGEILFHAGNTFLPARFRRKLTTKPRAS